VSRSGSRERLHGRLSVPALRGTSPDRLLEMETISIY
jgi:hypothetical protein